VIECANAACRGWNDGLMARCQHCGTPLVYRFLLATGAGAAALNPGDVLVSRYRVQSGGLLLDTQPALPPQPLAQVPPLVLPYLKLAASPLAVPRPYGYLPAAVSGLGAEVLLLESGAVGQGAKLGDPPGLLPTLAQQWATASPLQQMQWLQQQAQLWQPLAAEGVAATLLQLPLLRVDQAALRLMTLEVGQPAPTLSELGRQWQALAHQGTSVLQVQLEPIVGRLLAGDVADGAALVDACDRALAALSRDPVPLAAVTFTDQGPSRSRNEDACYPPSGQALDGTVGAGARMPLVIVCDGIGGHEQGSVASHLAIDTIYRHLQPLTQAGGQRPTPREITHQIKQAIVSANDAIGDRNDRENRTERGRMGTTVVLALAYPPYLYIAHLGDSRAYRITPHTCTQVTLDDDVASREVRLGYALHRDAVQAPGAGSLVQALGINPSDYLYPTVQRFPLADHCLYLLCSDGLSDYDRVDMAWVPLLKPTVTATGSLAAVGRTLIEFANRLNGHDNVTVALVQPQGPALALKDPALKLDASPEPLSPLSVTPVVPGADGQGKADLVPHGGRAWGRWLWVLALGGLGLLGLGRVGTLLEQPAVEPVLGGMGPSFGRLGEVNLRQLDIPPVPVPSDVVGSYWQTSRLLTVGQSGPEANPAAGPEARQIPVGSVLYILGRQPAGTEAQVRFQLCSIPAGPRLNPPSQETATPGQVPRALSITLMAPGEEGALGEAQLYQAAVLMGQLTTTQEGACAS